MDVKIFNQVVHLEHNVVVEIVKRIDVVDHLVNKSQHHRNVVLVLFPIRMDSSAVVNMLNLVKLTQIVVLERENVQRHLHH